jgi:GTP-binding protein
LSAAAPSRSFSSLLPNDVVYTQKIPKKRSAFRDRIRIHVQGGRGGSGCSSYDTDPYGKGGPDGANGGRGGDVYLVATEQLSSFSLDSFHLRAHHGRSGGSGLNKGRNGLSMKVPIPAGVIVSEILATDASKGEYTLRFLADMDREGLEIKVASGGAGGLGNRAFKTKYRKNARFSTVGSYGTAKWLHLELKCIADVGLVGYPNAGKSSFLAAISNATPEIANYPFTTLTPQIGVVEEGGVLSVDHASGAPDAASTSAATAAEEATRDLLGQPLVHARSGMARIRVADLPGLIAGAATHNRGLGHEFLKHIQRTRVLCFVLDVSGNDARDPVSDFLSLQQELHAFDPSLLERPAIILANKIDNVGANSSGVAGKIRTRAAMETKLDELAAVTPLPIFRVSCLRRHGLAPVLQALFERVAASETARADEQAQAVIEGAERDKLIRREMQQREQQFIDEQGEDEEMDGEEEHEEEEHSFDDQSTQREPDHEAVEEPREQATSSAQPSPVKTSPGKTKRMTKRQLRAAAQEAAEAERVALLQAKLKAATT